jgi:hypothetical protein
MKNEEMKMKKQALLIALASALALGSVMPSFAQETENGAFQNGYSNGYNSGPQSAPQENNSGYSGPSGE